jgi:hypothetical protein
MRGELVIVRGFKGKPYIRRIWDIGEHIIYITNEKMFPLLINKDSRAIGPIGVPKDDVFKYDPMMTESINRFSEKSQFNWDKLTPWNSSCEK